MVAVECHVDWEAETLDIDMYFMKGTKVVCGDNHGMMADPWTMIPVSDFKGSTWEYFSSVRGETKGTIRESGEYTIYVEAFNNWDPRAFAGTPTPFTIDIWVYTVLSAQWHPHQNPGE